MDEKPKRRWFQFRLRTFFVLMAAVAAFLGWQASIVQERSTLLSIARERGAGISLLEDRPMGFLRDLMGDVRIYALVVYDDYTDKELDRLRSAFPEALIARATGEGDE